MNRTIVKAILVIGLLLPLSGCAFLKSIFGGEREAAEELDGLTNEQIDAMVREWGGRWVNGRWEIGGYYIDPTMMPSGVNISRGPDPGCRKHGWTQVIRESLDGQVVLDPTQLPDPKNNPGIRGWSKDRITPEGWVVDGDANSKEINEINSNTAFRDEPGMSRKELEENDLNPDARVYRMEAETCRRCLDPEGPFNACFKWHYVFIKGRHDQPSRSFMITSGQPESKPSDDFNKATALWAK